MIAADELLEDTAWVQEVFSSFLSLNDMPSAHQASEALKATQQAAASLKQPSTHSTDAYDTLPLLQMLLPNTSYEAVSMLAAVM